MTDKKFGAIKIDWSNLTAQFSPNIKLISKKNQSSTENIKETILRFEILSDKIDDFTCKTYSLEKNEIFDDEPKNKNNPWYFDFCGEENLIKKEEESSTASYQDYSEDSNLKPSQLFATLNKPPEQTPKKSILIPEIKVIKDTTHPSSVFDQSKKPATEYTKPTQTFNVAKPPTAPKLPPKEQEKAPMTPLPRKPIKPQISNQNQKVDSKIPPPTEEQLVFQTVQEQIAHLEDQLTSTRNIILTLDKRLSAGLFNLDEYLEKKNFLIKKIEKIKLQIEQLKKQ